MPSLSLRARVVFPVDGPPIDGGVVTISGARIMAVGSSAPTGDRCIDLGDTAIFPGLINAHTHLEFSNITRPLGEPGIALPEWIRLAIVQRNRRAHIPAKAIAAGCSESIRRGVTSLGEIATADGRAYVRCPLRLDLTLFREVIGFSRVRAESALAATIGSLDAAAAETAAEDDGGARSAHFGISPHAPYTVSPQLVRNLVDVSKQRGVPIAMHLAESAEELELLANNRGPFRELLEEKSMWDPAAIPPDSRPLDYLRILAGAPRALVVHGNYFSSEEFDFIAAQSKRMSLVHCARTHAYFRHPTMPLARLLAQGVRTVLGTDSRASNPDLCILSEMRYVAKHHPALLPSQILRMGTLSPAEALGLDKQVGSLIAGKVANLAVVPLPQGARGDADRLLASIFRGSEAPVETWFRGEKAHTAGIQPT